MSVNSSSTGTIRGGSLMIRRWPSTTVVSLPSACMLSRVRALATSFSARCSRPLASWPPNWLSASSTSRCAYQTASIGRVGELPHRCAVALDACEHDLAALLGREAVVAPGDGEAGRQPFDVPLEGAGQGLVEVVDVENEPTLGRCEGTEVGQVRVPAQLDPQSRTSGCGQVGRHGQRCSTVVGERRDQHPAVPDRHQLGHPGGRLTQQEADRVPVRARVERAVRLQWSLAPGSLPPGASLRAVQLLHGHDVASPAASTPVRRGGSAWSRQHSSSRCAVGSPTSQGLWSREPDAWSRPLIVLGVPSDVHPSGMSDGRVARRSVTRRLSAARTGTPWAHARE